MSGVHYVAVELVHGNSESQGRSSRYRTDRARFIHIYIGRRRRNA